MYEGVGGHSGGSVHPYGLPSSRILFFGAWWVYYWRLISLGSGSVLQKAMLARETPYRRDTPNTRDTRAGGRVMGNILFWPFHGTLCWFLLTSIKMLLNMCKKNASYNNGNWAKSAKVMIDLLLETIENTTITWTEVHTYTCTRTQGYTFFQQNGRHDVIIQSNRLKFIRTLLDLNKTYVGRFHQNQSSSFAIRLCTDR